MEKKTVQCDRCTAQISEETLSKGSGKPELRMLVDLSFTARVQTDVPLKGGCWMPAILDEEVFCSAECLLASITDWVSELRQAIAKGIEPGPAAFEK